ncbi:MAG: RagB/SusD family nutrient uptake outer membrane protein [Prevotella sp.]|nr:RagB/SusD family nutrient uptake outer membrane protein [Prevotella sp.]
MFNKLTAIIVCMLAIVSMSSCKDYLDKLPDSDVSPETAFKNFKNFQGFIEEMYNCIPNKESCNWCTNFNWGEDEIFNTVEGDAHFTHHVDLGDYRYWYSKNQQNYLWENAAGNGGIDPASTNKFSHALWPHAWYCIRKANLGLENLDLLVNATQEEKNIIAGQLYFFRAWWYEELMLYFGGLPYLKHTLSPTSLDYPRLSFRECADSCAEDFRKAADLLPVNWDNTTIGKQTKNDQRIDKAVALGYLGKVLLWAASPLTEVTEPTNEEKASGITVKADQIKSNGSQTYTYNVEYAQKAAEAFAECISLIDSKKTRYALAEFNYAQYEETAKKHDGLYNHERAEGANTCFTDIFYTLKQNWKGPGTCEAMLRGPMFDTGGGVNGSNWNMAKTWGTKLDGLVEHDKIIHQPTANYVNYAYGMADGTPAYVIVNGELVPNTAERGGSFDPTHPFKNRDPRFYHDIIFDGFRYVTTDIPSDDPAFRQQYCGLYTGGYTRDDNMASRTGYYTQKLIPHTSNKFDGDYNWGGALQAYLPYMRLADIYLMYAEACTAAGNTLKAVEAINVLRKRVGVDPVNSMIASDKNKLMDEVRRERACELAFEGFRWNDLQRWILLTVAPYNKKTSQEFNRVESADWFKKNDPADARVSNLSEKVILTRVLGTKHYWFPLPEADVNMFADFKQNPGW